MDKTSNADVLKHIKKYTVEIQKTIDRFGDSFDIFSKDLDYQRSISMCLLQIGELTNHLSEDYKKSTKQIIQWHMIKGLRNIFAHGYGNVQFEIVWESCKTDIPKLKEFCEKEIESFELLSQESVNPENKDE